MEKIELQFGAQTVEVICENKDALLALAEKINVQINNIRGQHPNATMLKLALLCALTLQNRVDSLETELMITKQKICQEMQYETQSECIEHKTQFNQMQSELFEKQHASNIETTHESKATSKTEIKLTADINAMKYMVLEVIEFVEKLTEKLDASNTRMQSVNTDL